MLGPFLPEFLPDNQSTIKKIAKSLNKSVELIKNKIAQLSGKKLVLSHCGCRIGTSYPEIYNMQIRTILSAMDELVSENEMRQGSPSIS